MSAPIEMNNSTKQPNMGEAVVNFQSYPPIFRQKANEILIVDHAIQEETHQPHNNIDVPTIDFQELSPEKVSGACREWGVFRVINHGIPATLLNQLHDCANKLFSYGFESKQAMFTTTTTSTNHPPAALTYFSGSPALTLSGVKLPSSPLNWIEGFNVLLFHLSHHRYEDPLAESFRTLLQEYGSHLTRVARALFRAMRSSLNLSPATHPESSFLSPETELLRVHRYLRCFEAEPPFGVNAHTDSSVVAILHQDDVGGLQVYKDQVWLDVKPTPDSLIVNLGDIMQTISNDDYVSVKHRVKVNRQKERISFGYFVFPVEDFVIKSSKYKPFSYGEFRAQVQQDVKNTGFKIGLPNFKISS